jgi:hypothetical protein
VCQNEETSPKLVEVVTKPYLQNWLLFIMFHQPSNLLQVEASPSRSQTEDNVDLCSFGQVFSRGLGVRHVGIVIGTRLDFHWSEKLLGLELGAWGLGDGLCGFVTQMCA